LASTACASNLSKLDVTGPNSALTITESLEMMEVIRSSPGPAEPEAVDVVSSSSTLMANFCFFSGIISRMATTVKDHYEDLSDWRFKVTAPVTRKPAAVGSPRKPNPTAGFKSPIR